jgi:hypothetical protein
MHSGKFICSIVGMIIFSVPLVSATPIRLTVQPEGINQVKLTFSPVIPGVLYEVLARTNGPDGHWMTFAGAFIGGSNKTISATCNLGGIKGLTLETLNHWKFVAGFWDDSDGNGLPDLYEDLVTRTGPFSGDDGYSDPDGDGWNNLQEFQNNTDPLRWDEKSPAPSGVGINYYTNGVVKISWSQWGGVAPDFYVIERAQRTFQPNLVRLPFSRPGIPLNKTNIAEYLARQRRLQRPNGQPFNRRPANPYVIGQFQVVAKVPSKSGVHDYHYEETNIAMTPMSEPVYRIFPHYTPPIHAVPTRRDATSIRGTIRSVVARQTADGYNLTVLRPVAHAWYLLLVRDKNDPQWRASGYFATDTNGSFHIHVDSRGMMAVSNQRPIALPEMKYLHPIIDPEFIAGCAEDSDGDGLPDIYEVLVTHTKPNDADTGNTGILDGYKEFTDDGWSNLEKFRSRVNPLQPNYPPPQIELKQPTWLDVIKATQLQSDLRYEAQIQIKRAGTPNYQPLNQSLELLYRMMNPRDPTKVRGNFDLRISWHVPQMQPHRSGNGP